MSDIRVLRPKPGMSVMPAGMMPAGASFYAVDPMPTAAKRAKWIWEAEVAAGIERARRGLGPLAPGDIHAPPCSGARRVPSAWRGRSNLWPAPLPSSSGDAFIASGGAPTRRALAAVLPAASGASGDGFFRCRRRRCSQPVARPKSHRGPQTTTAGRMTPTPRLRATTPPVSHRGP